MAATIERFGQYASAFERAYESDDWSILEPFFTEDAVYETFAPEPIGGLAEGRCAVFDYFERSVNGLDRRFATRELQLVEGPEVRDGAVWMRWRVTYRHPDVPDVVLDGESSAHYERGEGDRIVRLEDRIQEASVKQALEVLAAHAARLKPVGG